MTVSSFFQKSFFGIALVFLLHHEVAHAWVYADIFEEPLGKEFLSHAQFLAMDIPGRSLWEITSVERQDHALILEAQPAGGGQFKFATLKVAFTGNNELLRVLKHLRGETPFVYGVRFLKDGSETTLVRGEKDSDGIQHFSGEVLASNRTFLPISLPIKLPPKAPRYPRFAKNQITQEIFKIKTGPGDVLILKSEIFSQLGLEPYQLQLTFVDEKNLHQRMIIHSRDLAALENIKERILDRQTDMVYKTPFGVTFNPTLNTPMAIEHVYKLEDVFFDTLPAPTLSASCIRVLKGASNL